MYVNVHRRRRETHLSLCSSRVKRFRQGSFVRLARSRDPAGAIRRGINLARVNAGKKARAVPVNACNLKRTRQEYALRANSPFGRCWPHYESPGALKSNPISRNYHWRARAHAIPAGPQTLNARGRESRNSLHFACRGSYSSRKVNAILRSKERERETQDRLKTIRANLFCI